MKKTIIFLLFFFFSSSSTFASSYVLPYPSAMPGGISYKLHLVWEKAMQYWYFGDFGQFEYNLKESDKYVVEAKTLFEYDQYLLAVSALEKSNDYFTKALPHLENAKLHGKDITEDMQIFKDATVKHITTLEKIRNETPITFNWSPEKSPSSQLQIRTLLNNAIIIRLHYITAR